MQQKCQDPTYWIEFVYKLIDLEDRIVNMEFSPQILGNTIERAVNSKYKTADAFLSAAVQVDKTLKIGSFLIRAVQNRHLKCVKTLIHAGINVNFQDKKISQHFRMLVIEVIQNWLKCLFLLVQI